jgi:hypothetical protein
MTTRGRSSKAASVSPAARSSLKTMAGAAFSVMMRTCALMSRWISARNVSTSQMRKPPLAMSSATAVEATVMITSLRRIGRSPNHVRITASPVAAPGGEAAS